MEEVERMSDTLKRYVVDERTGCAAIRDTKNEEYQHEGHGLYSNFSSVIEFVSYHNDYNGDATDTQKAESALKIKYLNDLCGVLNGESPKPKTRTEYVKVEFEHAWEAVKAFEEGEEFHEKSEWFEGEGYEYSIIGNLPELIRVISMKESVYRRVEKPVTVNNELLEFINSLDYDVSRMIFEDEIEIGALNREDFIEMCRVALRATGELE